MTARIAKPRFAIVLRTTNPLKDGTFPVCLRISFMDRRKYYTIGPPTTSEKWNEDIGRYIKNQEENIKLNALELKAKKILTEFQESEKQFSFDRFESEFFVNSNMRRVLVFLDEEIKRLQESDRAGTYRITKTLRNALHTFRKGKDLLFVDVDMTFLEKFEGRLLKSCSVNGVAVYMRHLRAIYNRAIDLGLAKPENYPFGKYKVKTEVTAKRALSRKQMEAIINKPLEEGTRKWHSRNYFIFSYMTRGMNFVDLSRLTLENIEGDRIRYIRSKTKTSRSRGDGRAFNIPIRGLVRELINYYRKNHFTGAGYIFPILTKKYATAIQERWAIQKKALHTNKDLQEICGDLKIPSPETITFYCARHSWATISKHAGTSTEMIQEAMGHSNVKTTEIYLAQFEDEQLDKIDAHLDDIKALSVKK
ncbi:MAG: site-specific integrase [Bacteroidetes bacterium]|nr:site-specific integrase [Bacteroidota bacterium]